MLDQRELRIVEARKAYPVEAIALFESRVQQKRGIGPTPHIEDSAGPGRLRNQRVGSTRPLPGQEFLQQAVPARDPQLGAFHSYLVAAWRAMPTRMRSLIASWPDEMKPLIGVAPRRSLTSAQPVSPGRTCCRSR